MIPPWSIPIFGSPIAQYRTLVCRCLGKSRKDSYRSSSQDSSWLGWRTPQTSSVLIPFRSETRKQFRSVSYCVVESGYCLLWCDNSHRKARWPFSSLPTDPDPTCGYNIICYLFWNMMKRLCQLVLVDFYQFCCSRPKCISLCRNMLILRGSR